MPATPEIWLPEFTANATIAGAQYEPRIVQLSTGNVLVAWTSDDDTGAGATFGTDIIGQLHDPFGTPLGPETRLNRGYVLDDEGDFDLAALNDGRFVVVYEDDEGASTNQAIRAEEWTSTATRLGVSIQSRTIATAPQTGDVVRTPTVTATADGGYVAGYERFDSSFSDHDLLYVTVAADGTQGPDRTAISLSDRAASEVEAATLANGDVVFVYDYGVADDAIAYAVQNLAAEPPLIVDYVADTSVNGGVDRAPAVAALAGGGFVIAWQNADGTDIDVQFQRYDAGGAARGEIVIVDGGGSTDEHNEVALVALADGGFVMLWDDDETGATAGRGQRYDAAGVAVGARFVFDGSNAQATDAVLLDDGRIALVWQDGEIRTAILDTRDVPNATLGASGVQTGTVGDDAFTAAPDARIVHAWDGDDAVTAEGIVKEYRLGAGDDRIDVTSSINADSYDGGAGIDTIDWSAAPVAGATFDLAAGVATRGVTTEAMTGFETLSGTGFADVILGDAGRNVLIGNGGADSIAGGAGDDLLGGADGDDTVAGGAGDDDVFGGFGRDRVSGGTGDDAAYGAAGDDTVLGEGGDDSLFGNGGNDLLGGGEGADRLDGGVGDDSLYGSAGADTLLGGEGADAAFGGAGRDLLGGADGRDLLRGGGGDDDLYGAAGADTLLGEGGGDVLYGGSGGDLLGGGAGADTLFGGGQGDALFGAAGRDRLSGGGGSDTLAGGGGADTLTGGAGGDVFVFSAPSDSRAGGLDRVTDFGAADLLNLAAIDADATLGGNQAFVFVGTAAFGGAAGELRFATDGTNGFVLGDVDGDGVQDLNVALLGVTAVTAGDLLL